MNINDLFSRFQGLKITLLLLLHAAFLHGQEPAYILPDTLPPADSMPYEQLTAVSAQLLRQADILLLFHTGKTAPLQQARETAESLLEAARLDTTLSKDSLKTLQKSLKIAKSREKEALREQQRAEQAAENARDLAASSDTTALRLKIPKVFKEIQKVAALSRPPVEKPVAEVIGPVTINEEAPPTLEPEAVIASEPVEGMPDSTAAATDKPEKGKRKQAPAPAKKIRSYDPATDLMLNPPAPPCRIAVERRDAFSGELYRETAQEELFRFTNEVMKKVLEGKTHIRCDASLASAGSKTTLRLQFYIQDPNARRTFGGLAQGSMAVLKFTDGTTHTLYNNRTDNGAQQPDTGAYIFSAQYEMDALTQKKIAAQELDKLRIAWTTGYEDYDIYFVDVLMRQLQCLMAPKP